MSLLFSPATGPVQAEPRSHRGRSEEALHVFTPERQGGAGPLPLQRPWGAPAHGERRDLGLQQGESTLRPPMPDLLLFRTLLSVAFCNNNLCLIIFPAFITEVEMIPKLPTR